ncbi:MAG: DUF3108 domain-containing protein [candidate division Zixibacteria bacterium]|nr:DUF3108 domain-containing protein [candidate division Zixibacteria bacterium]
MLNKQLVKNALLLLVIAIGLVPVFYFSIVELGIAEAAAGTEYIGSSSIDPADRYLENLAFGVGEKFTFDVKYGFITAGTAEMEVMRLVEYENRPCYQIVTRANSNSFFSSFYKVEDRVESIMDATGLFSWRFEKNLREGNYSSDRQYAFDQRNHKVVYKGDTISIEPFVQDAISMLYFVRVQPLEVGKAFFLHNFIDGKKYNLEVKVLKKETVTVDAGTFECLVVEPITQSVGVFKHEGRLKVWLTDDRLRMPVLMKSKVIVGSITVELTDYTLGNLDEF